MIQMPMLSLAIIYFNFVHQWKCIIALFQYVFIYNYIYWFCVTYIHVYTMTQIYTLYSFPELLIQDTVTSVYNKVGQLDTKLITNIYMLSIQIQMKISSQITIIPSRIHLLVLDIQNTFYQIQSVRVYIYCVCIYTALDVDRLRLKTGISSSCTCSQLQSYMLLSRIITELLFTSSKLFFYENVDQYVDSKSV